MHLVVKKYGFKPEKNAGRMREKSWWSQGHYMGFEPVAPVGDKKKLQNYYLLSYLFNRFDW
jgi:hypothetical protein